MAMLRKNNRTSLMIPSSRVVRSFFGKAMDGRATRTAVCSICAESKLMMARFCLCLLHILIANSLTDILRVIWSRGKARADRWTEEVALLLEEMRRTLAYCEWKSSWWRERENLRSGSIEVIDGASAYARKQADMWTELSRSFADQWAPIICRFNLPSDWPASYSDRTPDNRGNVSAIGRNWTEHVDSALTTMTLSTHGHLNGSFSDSSTDSE